jgi:hypothetical protein
MTTAARGHSFVDRLRGIFFAIAPLLICASATAGELQTVRGTTVALIPPDGFELMTPAGFENSNIGGSIVVTELPKGAFAEFVAILSDVDKVNARFSAGGISASSVEQLRTGAGVVVPLVHGTQDAVGGKYDKWMAVYGGAKTALVTLQVLQQNALDPAIVRAVFASVEVGSVPSEGELLSLLPFKIEIVAPFRFVGTPTGAGILLTVGPDDLNTGSKQAVLFVVTQLSPALSEDLEQMAETQLRSTSSFRAAEIQSRAPTKFAAENGTMLEGISSKDGKTFRFRQYFSVGKDGNFIRMVAAGSESQMKELLPAIEQIADSVVFKPKT